ncbi:MAG: carbohydrate binding family 9 domain-containing protein, partial [Acidobacteriota bacterium]|nr:carbohydrate binding family 9 domain-containing protein [Acidobacteriota bacterium]
MKKNLALLLAVFIFTLNLQAQNAAQTEIDKSGSVLNEKKKEADDKNISEKTQKYNQKDENKKEKSRVNVSSRFRDTIAPEKLSAVNIPRFETMPVIDGKLDDEVWKRAAIFKDFYQVSPGDNIAPSKPTVVFIGYDAENLYIGFYCYDEPDKIRATVAKRDAVFGEDNVRVFLDTYDDQRRAYLLGFNPLGIQQDGIYTEGQRDEDFSVDVVMESKGVIVADGWTLEVKIPFKSLRYSAGKEKNWGIHIARYINRLNNESSTWMPFDRNISSWLSQQGKITGLENIKVERTLELVPSITVSETGNRRATFPISAGRFVNEGIKQDIGLNLKFNITPNITLDAAFNPDYAEIEADALVVTTNQRFPIFFQEKRPFFLEGADIFQTPLQPFYSRTIVDPDIATKLTGKVGKTSFGFLVASDNAPGNYSEDELISPLSRLRVDEFLNKNATFAVARVKRDFGKDNNIGFFGAARMFPEQRNFVGGFDGKLRWNDKTVSQFQILGTHSRRCFFDSAFEPVINPLQAQSNREICQTGIVNSNASPYNRYRTGNGLG